MPAHTATDLLTALGQYRILEPGQLDTLRRTYPGRGVDPRALSKDLLQRGWLTNFQVNQLLAGRGAELVLGSYVVLDLLGEGAAGQVYRAKHLAMNRLAALKVLRKELLADKEVVARFYREIEVVSQISHPNIVHAFDAGPVGSTLILAMEFIEGVDLERLVKKSGKLHIAQACDYIHQAALGLQHAHEKGLVHRDIKPSNLLVNRSASSVDLRSGLWGQVKILDLGLARLRYPGNSATKNLTVLAGSSVMQGTPDYMAPEQAIDFHTADIRADIYSLGCTLYCLLAGQPPFPGGSLTEKLMKHQAATPPAIDDMRKDVPPALTLVLKKMLAKKPPERYAKPDDVAAALRPFVVAPRRSALKLSDSGSGSRSGTQRKSALKLSPAPRRSKVDLSSPKPPARPAGRGSKRWLVLALLAGVTFIGLVGFFFVLGGPEETAATRPAATHAHRSALETFPFTKRDLSTQVIGDTRPRPKTTGGKLFEGLKDFVEVPHADELEPASMTVEAWVYPLSLPEQDEKRRWLVNKNVHENTEGHYALMILGNQVGAYLNIGGGDGNKKEAWSRGDLLKKDRWQHLAFTYDGFGLRVYHDGVEVALAVVDKQRVPGKTPLVIGRRQDGYDKSAFHGKLDDIRIYNRPLAEAELKLHFARPDIVPDKNAEKGLVFLQRF
ncbi:MAG: protein kinase [Planctomycetia bacterium]|nr:protein kinase [Planctomycetia bacterium]